MFVLSCMPLKRARRAASTIHHSHTKGRGASALMSRASCTITTMREGEAVEQSQASFGLFVALLIIALVK
jgi:hypothetical protein